jgi:diguanylate cyclase (GGDEF)-like protein/PAS domain S-box-containing protein
MNTTSSSLKILLIDSDPNAADKIRAALASSISGSFDLESVYLLADGVARLKRRGVMAVLLNLFLGDSTGIETFDELFANVSDVPILIVGGDVPEAVAQEAVRRGAQDYLLAGDLNGFSLPRALRNAIARKAIEDASYAEKERAMVTLNSIGDAVLCTNVSGNITYLNAVAEALTGWSRAEAAARPLAEVFHIIDGTTREIARDPMKMAIVQNKTVGLTVNCVLIRRDGLEFPIEDSAAPIHDRLGCIIGAVIVFHDVSAARAISMKMTHSAQHDPVTNLPNRLLLNDRITQSIESSRRQRRYHSMAVLYLDLDHFKYINDSLGHSAGDKLLQSVSKRLLSSVRATDTVSRQGGDEFVILLSEITDPEDAATCARKILLSLTKPHSIGGTSININASLGIALFPGNGEDVEALVQNADMAMYHAKQKGRNNFQFFKWEMNLKAVERQSLGRELRRALEQEEFVLHYQPKVNIDSGHITGVEALLRWQQPDQGLVPPLQFIPIAEECGLIVEIGRWVLREACTQACEWKNAGFPPLRIAVNVSAVEFRRADFVANVRKIFSETNVDPQWIEFELTESVLLDGADEATSVLKQIKSLGVHLAIDDFGMSYSSLGYLHQYPIDVLKIDKHFIHSITSDRADCKIVSAIISMGKSLDYVVVAEGVETLEQRKCLQDLRCAEGQGYLFGRPIVADEFASLLRPANTHLKGEALYAKQIC